MEVFQVVADVCRKNKLRYFADWGTLLGAVRHKGMIPWDDDIDICLMREEYNELIKILPKELPHWICCGRNVCRFTTFADGRFCTTIKSNRR